MKDSFRGFVSWKQKSQITRFVSIRKDSYTNPASLEKTHGIFHIIEMPSFKPLKIVKKLRVKTYHFVVQKSFEQHLNSNFI